MKAIKASEFDLGDYLPSHKVIYKDADRTTAIMLQQKAERKFNFKDSDIKKLPLLTEGSIDLRDTGVDSELAEGATLILRITKTKKAFYPILTKYYKGHKKGIMGSKIGDWVQKPNSSHFPTGSTNTRKAREALYALVEEQKLLSRESHTFRKMTIRSYIEGGYYTADRERKPMKNSHFNPPTDDTIRALLNQFPDHLDRKIGDVEELWVYDLKAAWQARGVSTGTMRGYYAMFNSLFNICHSMGYLTKNPIDNHYYLFPRNPEPTPQELEKKVFNWNIHDVVEFIFSDEFDVRYREQKPRSANPMGKIIVASCVLAGIRPIEARRNLASNYDVSKETIVIPAGVQNKTKTGRLVQVPHDIFWNEVKKYKKTLSDQSGFMFPSNASKDGYVSQSVYRYHWTTLRQKFGLDDDAFLYHNRHTLASRLKTVSGGSQLSATTLGDNESTANRFYAANSSEHAKGMMQAVYDSSTKAVEPTETNLRISSAVSEDAKATVNVELSTLPKAVRPLFNQFLNGKVLPDNGGLFAEQWQKFVSVVRHMRESKDLGADVDIWLMMQ
ncbi:hypothetical protein P7F88_23195 [Vibrio hannami]|uniref:hypothetical protein n=1 Tax=Vibrio hannami TaxID=2717094 RepID=UPI00240ED995|nr:hypothetical protein [Vibrio hannami]MDG3088810.1 hypothetical protein [Vibrio hannami]